MQHFPMMKHDENILEKSARLHVVSVYAPQTRTSRAFSLLLHRSIGRHFKQINLE